MTVQVIKRAQHLHCYKCGSRDIVNICHHCGKAMCEKHTHSSYDSLGKLVNIELENLGLKDTLCGEGTYHCDTCNHTVKKPGKLGIIFGCLLFIVGLVLLFFSLSFAAAFAILGIVSVILWSYRYSKRKGQIKRNRAPIPFLPRFEEVKVNEEINACLSLNEEGQYFINIEQVEGTISIMMRFAKPEKDRINIYRQKYGLNGANDLQFHAGFVSFGGDIGFAFVDNNSLINNSGNILSLSGSISAYPYLSGTSEKSTEEWIMQKHYKLIDEIKASAFPVRLVPSLMQQAGQRVLEIELQWGESNNIQSKWDFARIELLELCVPIEWGEAESDGAIFSIAATGDGSSVRRIIWKKPMIAEKDISVQRSAFYIRFENKINLRDTINGSVDIVYNNSISGINDVILFYPVGNINESISSEIKTRVHNSFALNLSILRHQDVRLVPNPKLAADADREETMTFNDIIPNQYSVVNLTNRISKQGFYVQRIVEDPPRTGERANVINRSWDIAGRRYIGVYPIDFHLNISGEEQYSGDVKAIGGKTKTILKVQGMYANKEMEEQIINIWEQLSNLMNDALNSMPKAVISSGSDDRAIQRSEEIDEEQYLGRDEAILSDKFEILAALQSHIEKLEEAFVSAHVFEKTYLEIKDRIENELQYIKTSIANLKTI